MLCYVEAAAVGNYIVETVGNKSGSFSVVVCQCVFRARGKFSPVLTKFLTARGLLLRMKRKVSQSKLKRKRRASVSCTFSYFCPHDTFGERGAGTSSSPGRAYRSYFLPAIAWFSAPAWLLYGLALIDVTSTATPKLLQWYW